MQDMTGVDVATRDASRMARKRPVEVEVEFATAPGRLQTLEGFVSYRTGDALVTGETGERWPIRQGKFMDSYEPVLADRAGTPGKYRKRPLVVHALQMDQPFAVAVGWQQDLIAGKPGDWLVQYAPGDYGIVAAAIFRQTYDLL